MGTGHGPPVQSAAEPLFASIALTPIATVITDPGRRDNPIVAVNAPFLELTGYSRDEVIGRNCRFLAGPGTESAPQRLLREAIARNQPILTELTNYRKDGSSFLNALMIAPVLDEDGRVRHFIGSQMEVFQPETLSAARRRRAEELVRALTPRQRQVLEHMIGGYRNKQIAAFLGIDEKTVKMHRARLLVRLGAASSADAIRLGVEAGVLLSDRG